MRKLIIIAGGLTLLVLAGVGFWFLLPGGETASLTRQEQQQNQEEQLVVEEAAVKGDAAEAETQPVAEAAIKEEEQRQAKADKAEAKVERQPTSRPVPAQAPAREPLPTHSAEVVAPPLASPADNERKAQTTGGDNETKKLQQARQALERLPKGKIVLDAPEAMNVGDTRAVYANVGINVPIELLQKHSRPTDQSHEAVLSVSSEMVATLTGPGFAITPTTPEQQGVAEGFPTVWSWNVEAKQEGEQELEATLYVLLPTRQRIDSYTHKIGVSVKAQSWGEWLKSSKEEVEAVHVIAITLGSAIMAVLGWLGLSYSRRRQTENRNQPEAT